jgi:hypothetical protein
MMEEQPVATVKAVRDLLDRPNADHLAVTAITTPHCPERSGQGHAALAQAQRRPRQGHRWRACGGCEQSQSSFRSQGGIVLGVTLARGQLIRPHRCGSGQPREVEPVAGHHAADIFVGSRNDG